MDQQTQQTMSLDNANRSLTRQPLQATPPPLEQVPGCERWEGDMFAHSLLAIHPGVERVIPPDVAWESPLPSVPSTPRPPTYPQNPQKPHALSTTTMSHVVV